MPLLTIVFTDVVGSTLTKRDESLGRDNRERDRAYLEKIQTPHFNTVRECCQAHGGKEVSTIGDAFYLAFEDPVEGVRCAVEIQNRLASAPIQTPLGRLQLRIGVHSGYPEPYEGGWHGADVDTAARVESAAGACQILLSARTYELVRHMTDVKFRSRGEFALKGMDRITLWEADWDGKAPRRMSVPSLTEARRKMLVVAWAGIAVLTLIALSLAYRAYVNRKPPGGANRATAPGAVSNGRPSVAVLEFQNRGAASDAWLSTALAGMVTNELTTGGEIRAISDDDVAATASDYSLAGMITFSLEGMGKHGTTPKADYVLQGSYTTSADVAPGAIHVEMELDDSQTGASALLKAYEGSQGDLTDLVRKIGADLRDRLEVQVPSEADAKAAQASFPTNPIALQRYNEGVAKLKTFDAVGARDALTQAVNLEPHFALAHAALANAWEVLGYDKDAEQEAKKAFDYSRGLDERDSGLIEARYRTITRDWNRAIQIYSSLWGIKRDEPKYLLDVAGVETEADRGKDALATLNELRNAGHEFAEDPRVDYLEALADEKLTNLKDEHAAAARAASKASAQGAKLLAAQAYWQDCSALFLMGDLTQAETECQTSSEKADMAAGREVKARAQSVLGRIMQSEGKLSEAMELHESALSTATDIGSQKDVIGALVNIAEVQSSEGQLSASYENQQKAIGIAKRIGDTQQTLSLQTNYGVDLITRGNYGDAKVLYQQELTTARGVGDREAISDTLQNLAVIFLQTGDLKTAEDDAAQSLGIARQAELRNEELTALSGLGDVRMARGNLSGARASYDEGLRLSLQAGDEGNLANCRLGLAKLAIENGDATTAEKLARQASETFVKFALVDSQGDALNTLARTLAAQGKFGDAQAQLDRARTLGVQDEAVKLSLSVTSAELGAHSGNAQPALQTLYSDLADAKRMKLAMLQLEIRLAEAEIESSLPGGTADAPLLAIEDDARGAGYALLADKAKHLRGAGSR
jgi:eukaryotic-like serine/threonine-protein kinase